MKGKLQPRRRLAGVDAAFLKAHSPGPFKITMPSPSTVLGFGYKPGVSDAVYPTREALHADTTAIVHDEMLALVADGCAYVQLDEGFNSYVNPDWRGELELDGRDPMDVLTKDIAADNECYDANDAAKYCPIEQLALSTQCGFQGAAMRDGAHMTIDQERRKLELIVEVAHKVWG